MSLTNAWGWTLSVCLWKEALSYVLSWQLIWVWFHSTSSESLLGKCTASLLGMGINRGSHKVSSILETASSLLFKYLQSSAATGSSSSIWETQKTTWKNKKCFFEGWKMLQCSVRKQNWNNNRLKPLPYLKKQQHEDLAESQLQEGVEENPGPQFHRPCQGTKPWLPCDLGKTPQTCQVPPQYHLKGRNKTSMTRTILHQQTRQSCYYLSEVLSLC